jgi:hypothetical protein
MPLLMLTIRREDLGLVVTVSGYLHLRWEMSREKAEQREVCQKKSFS